MSDKTTSAFYMQTICSQDENPCGQDGNYCSDCPFKSNPALTYTFSPGPHSWQLCPKCTGQGVMSMPPNMTADVTKVTYILASYTCDVCFGEKIISSESGLPPSRHDA